MQTEADKPQPKPKKEDSAITDYEREQLRDLLQHPGWQVYQKINAGFVAAVRAGTEIMSLEDPLGNKEKLANMWAYFKMILMFNSQIENGVKRELEWLTSSENKRTPEQEKERLRHWYATGQIGAPPDDWEPRKH